MITVEDLLEVIENETIDEVEIYYKDHYDEEYIHLIDKGMKTDPTVQFQLWPFHNSVISHLSFAENDRKKQMSLELIKDSDNS